MGLKETIENEMREAMKGRDSFKLGVVRFLLAQIKNKEIDCRRQLADDEIHKIILTLAKQRKESIVFSEKAGRPDIAEKETRELTLLEQYLPQLLTPEELDRIVREIALELNAAGAKDFGRVMKAVMSKVSGRCDGGVVSESVKRILA